LNQEDEKKVAEAAGVKAEPEARSGTQEQPKAAPPEAKAEEKDSAEQELRKELEEAKKKLADAEKALAAQKDTFLRTAAEYDNYRKRTSREKETAYSDATADAVKEFLGVEDNLERALAQKECSADDLRKGVEMTQKQMQDALKKLGVSEMEAEGKPFDPMLHSAVAHIEDEKLGENVVAQVFQKGYLLNGKVVRHAMVQTAN
jgi:molecular chaperone GrpE